MDMLHMFHQRGAPQVHFVTERAVDGIRAANQRRMLQKDDVRVTHGSAGSHRVITGCHTESQDVSQEQWRNKHWVVDGKSGISASHKGHADH